MDHKQQPAPGLWPSDLDGKKQLADAVAIGEQAFKSGQFVSNQEAKERLGRWFIGDPRPHRD